MVIPQSYFLNDDVLFLAKDLLGKYLFTKIDGQMCGGIITETEAYQGMSDRASHAYGGRCTRRNQVMYEEGGVIYVFLCYGIHHLLNFVTNRKGIPDAILIRSIFPTHGEELMLKRSGSTKISPKISEGPGRTSKVLGICTGDNGMAIPSEKIWLENRQLVVPEVEILKTPRIGVEYAREDALLPYRFVWTNPANSC